MIEFVCAVEYQDGQPWRIPITVNISFSAPRKLGPVPLPARRIEVPSVPAIVDTGCTHSVVPMSIIDQLEAQWGERLPTLGTRAASFADGRQMSFSTYDLSVRLVDAGNRRWPKGGPLTVSGGLFAMANAPSVVVGLDILQHVQSATHTQAALDSHGWLTLILP